MEIAKILPKIGLSQHQSDIYLSLVESGPARISDIYKNTGIHRPIIYQVLPKLEAKELISHSIKGKQKYFAAEPPRKLRKLFSDLIDSFDSQIDLLEETYSAKSIKPKVKYLEGKTGLKSVHEDLVNSLKRDDIYYRFTANTDLEKFEKYHPQNYKKRRDSKGLQRFIINNEAVSREKKSKKLGRFTRTIPAESDLFEHGINLLIYDKKTAYLDLNSETAFVIENKNIAEFHKSIFKLIWEKLEKQ